jgi:predicted small integral membrane protein
MVHDVVVVVQLSPLASETVYEAIVSPAVLLGAVHVIVACESLAEALALLGALATPTGVTAFDGVEAADAPTALVATTENV